MKYPDIGELDKLVKIKGWADQANAGMGIDQVFDAGQDIWARIEPAGSALFFGTAQIEPGVKHRLATWRTATINERKVTRDHVVEHDGIRYRVRRASDINDRRDFVLIDLESLGEIPA